MIEWLQSWYANHCDGVWEHTSGVRIDTIDNPGWSLKVDLIGTELEHREFVRRNESQSVELIAAFRGWAEP